MKLLLASQNPGKLDELHDLLKGLALELIQPSNLGLSLDIVEGVDSYRQNAAAKALAYAKAAGIWTLADDSGLEVDALDGAPGLRSARLAGPGRSDADRREHLLHLLIPYSRPWRARFQCTIALASPGGALSFTSGSCEGEIIPTERGEHGFGYDPIFLLQASDKTMAELAQDEKNRLSHRAKAVNELIPVILERLKSE
jgi:XTP/dITP diphosphohydrolase